ncbi:cellulose synthase, partial [Salmonella enterica subsp. enterica serovar Oslo]|nr:cellulose synthase [Salmonella enterica subsp. enterica serovar Oslo]
GLLRSASAIVYRRQTADLTMGGCRFVEPYHRQLEEAIDQIVQIQQTVAFTIPAQLVTSDERFLRLKFDEDIPLSRRRELVRVVLARADAWINPPRPQDNPFRSFFTILRCVFELFWLTWKTRRSQRNRATVAKTAQEDGTL